LPVPIWSYQFLGSFRSLISFYQFSAHFMSDADLTVSLYFTLTALLTLTHVFIVWFSWLTVDDCTYIDVYCQLLLLSVHSITLEVLYSYCFFSALTLLVWSDATFMLIPYNRSCCAMLGIEYLLVSDYILQCSSI